MTTARRIARIATCAIALSLGAFAGVMLTVTHQSSAGGFPWGIVVAVVLTAALLAGLRIVFASRAVALCAAVGLIAAVALLSTLSIGGSVLVPANPAGYTWTFAPVLIALVVLGWPRVSAQDRPAGGR